MFSSRAFRLQRHFVVFHAHPSLRIWGPCLVESLEWHLPPPKWKIREGWICPCVFHFFRLFKGDALFCLIRTLACWRVVCSDQTMDMIALNNSNQVQPRPYVKRWQRQQKKNNNNVVKWKVISSLRLGIPCSGGFSWLFPTGLTVACGTNFKAPNPKQIQGMFLLITHFSSQKNMTQWDSSCWSCLQGWVEMENREAWVLLIWFWNEKGIAPPSSNTGKWSLKDVNRDPLIRCNNPGGDDCFLVTFCIPRNVSTGPMDLCKLFNNKKPSNAWEIVETHLQLPMSYNLITHGL